VPAGLASVWDFAVLTVLTVSLRLYHWLTLAENPDIATIAAAIPYAVIGCLPQTICMTRGISFVLPRQPALAGQVTVPLVKLGLRWLLRAGPGGAAEDEPLAFSA